MGSGVKARGRSSICATYAAMLLVAGCARGDNPENPAVPLYSPEMAAPAREYPGQIGGEFTEAEATGFCPYAGNTNFIAPRTPGRTNPPDSRMRYSPGDRFNILIPSNPELSGDYAINADGTVTLPFAGDVKAVGLTNAELNARIQEAFERANVLKQDGARLAVRPMQYAPINISISGAVFAPGRVTINAPTDKPARVPQQFGDAPLDRYVAAGLRAGGGVRPDADISSIFLIRGGRRYRLDWRGALTGENVDDAALIEGDKLEVAEGPCFQTGLIRPSQITPPGIRIFQSNLTVPATNNASSSIGQYSGSLPYGTRFLQALASANCIGGNMATNAARQAVLISRNPKTLETGVVQRSIEELVRSAGRDAVNPHLMPDDAIACYDSSVTEFRDALSVIQQVITAGQTTLQGGTYLKIINRMQ
jgi:polysaccharide biosynthesis/export protein